MDARKFDYWPPELLALVRIAHAKIEGFPGDAGRTRGGLDAHAFVASRVRARSSEHRHQIAPRGVSDPCLVSGDAPSAVCLTIRTGPDRCEVGSGIRLGEDGGRKYLAGRNAG